ncbi:ricin-type beta-trefoil lectin domain protein [Kitasatospora sp. NPDC059812]|uniref:ricin-type beta-trefoil lectin domain protein n=1 Tax=Kitasatospora sp. NPDC059812 TaxID=3346958 RepID=UPI00365F5E2E
MSHVSRRRAMCALPLACLALAGLPAGEVPAVAKPAASALAGPAVPAAAAQPRYGQTPGSYSYWTIAGDTVLTEVTFRNTVVTTPGDGDVFWSSQFNFDGNLSYIGFQDKQQNDGLFNWSTWADTELQFADGTQGSHCWNSTGEGQHLQCANSTVNQGRPVTGHTYAFQVRIDPATHWVTATVTDETAGTSFVLGSVLLPKSQQIKYDWNSWVEYFDWNRPAYACNDNAYSENRWGPMTGNGGTLTATNTGTSTSGACDDMIRQRKQPDGTLLTELGLGQSARWPLRFANGACLDRGGANGAISYRCATTPNANQLFVLARDGSLHTAQGNECLAAPAAVGGQVVRAACDGSAAQRWSYDGVRQAVVNPAGWALTSSTAGRNSDPVTARPADGSPEQTLTAVVRTDA